MPGLVVQAGAFRLARTKLQETGRAAVTSPRGLTVWWVSCLQLYDELMVLPRGMRVSPA